MYFLSVSVSLCQLHRAILAHMSTFSSGWHNSAHWLIPAGALLSFAGYVGPWVDHPAAGLVITGQDLGEYVKFLVHVRSGEIPVWREGFYLPLVAVSLALSLAAYRRAPAYGPIWRALLLAGALAAALNLLPPAWSPAVLRSGEFRLQVVTLGACAAAALLSPLLALLPGWLAGATIALLSAAAIVVPLRMFYAVLPTIAELYARPLSVGWGVWVLVAGLAVLTIGGLMMAAAPKKGSEVALRPV